MTLIISVVAGWMALQVGDRLVSAANKEWDPDANKTVLLLGLDGHACISYSGLAYLGGRPTDQFIAEALSNRATVAGPRGGLAIHFDSSLLPRVGPALARLRTLLEEHLLNSRQPTEPVE